MKTVNIHTEYILTLQLTALLFLIFSPPLHSPLLIAYRALLLSAAPTGGAAAAGFGGGGGVAVARRRRHGGGGGGGDGGGLRRLLLLKCMHLTACCIWVVSSLPSSF